MPRTALMAIATLCFLTTSVLAQEATTPDAPTQEVTPPDVTPQDVPPQTAPNLPLWEAGLFGFGYTQPAYPGADERVSTLLPFPYAIYRGKYLRVDRGTVGVRAVKTPRIELDVGFSGSLGSRSSDIAVRRGMADLGTMIEFGPRLKINLGDISNGRSDSRLQFPLRAVIDVSHDFISRGIAFEPQWVSDMRLSNRWFIATNLGAVFGDKKLNETFYGVAPGEATPERPAYSARSGLIALSAGLLVAHSLTPDVRLFCILRGDSLAIAANRDSPLVRQNSGWSAGIGIVWTLGRSGRSAID